MTAASSVRDSIDELALFLERCEDEAYAELDDIGWLTTKRAGVRPMVFFINGAFALELQGEDRPSWLDSTDPTERLFRALHPDPEPDLVDDLRAVRLPLTELLAAHIRSALIGEGAAELPGLGRFEIFERPGRPGVNPVTGDSITIPPRRSIRFLCSPDLRDRVRR